ncbi:MAG: ribosome assembly cofactor RimP [Paludibacter sp.]|nr:ribosome assembly cofactor RimP [Paludibacter sp.]MDD4199346.1 ribosome assembly cofactor RimP [Paludibacter sp.]MDD4429022.1 ribosome assembly cofactor RimP [Paludibacter sp.]
MLDKSIVSQIVESYLQENECYLVDIKVTSDNRIQVEIDSFKGVSLDDCVELNRYIESKLDREVEDYELEVSSAGLSSPFKILKQYEKNLGKEVEVLTSEGKKLTGVLNSVTSEGIVLTVERIIKTEAAKRKTTIQEEITLSFNNIKTTKLIIRFK